MEIIREDKIKYKISSPGDIYKYLSEFKNEDREYFIVMGLDTENKIVYREINSIGINNANMVHPREIFRRAIISSVNSIILAHNHPSGNLKPSQKDINITKKLEKAGELLQIPILDHIIISRDGYKSVKED